MNILVRRVIVILFFLAFFIISPILIFYSSGYRYDFAKNKIIKTGSFFIQTFPEGADIYVNNEFQEKKTPQRVLYLLPNDYDIKIEMPNYFTWSKRLGVESQKTTQIVAVRLFPQNQPQNIFKGKANFFIISPNKKYLLYSTVDELWQDILVLNLKSLNSKLIYRNSIQDQIVSIKWSPNSNKVLLEKNTNDSKKYLAVDINDESVADISKQTQLAFSNLIWDPKNEKYLYGMNENSIYFIDMQSFFKPIEVLNINKNQTLKNFYISAKDVYIIKDDNQNSYIEKYSLDSNSQKAQKTNSILKMSKSNYEFENCYLQNICFMDKNSNTLYLMNEDLTNMFLTIDNVKNIEWKINSLLYHNENEIWADKNAFSQDEKFELFSRISSNITKCHWFEKDEYIAFVSDNTLKIIEMDKRDKQNMIVYDQMNVSDFEIIDRGANIIFKGEQQGQPGIFILNIDSPN